MSTEFKTLTFEDTAAGQAEKLKALSWHADRGWTIVSETISQGKYDVDGAICNSLLLCIFCAPICAPLGFRNKQQKGVITVTLSRTEEAQAAAQEQLAIEREIEAQRQKERIIAAQEQFENARSERLAWLRSEAANKWGDDLTPYLGLGILKAIFDFAVITKPLGIRPEIGKCTRDTSGVTLRDANEQVIKHYTSAEVTDLPNARL
jgi:hypothetical protein